MTYNPFIPQPPDLPSDSQGDLLSNFGLINTFFGVDHVPFGNTIQSATLTNPIVITSPIHRLTTGNTVTVTLLKGLTPEQVIEDWPINGMTFVVTVVDENTFSLDGSNGTTYPPYIDNSGDFSSPDIDYGFHLKNFFPQAILADPNRAAPISSYYTKLNVNNIPNLFFQNGALASLVKQLSDLTIANETSSGRGFKTPWGMIINAGMVRGNSEQFITYNFPTPYTNRVFTLQLTVKPNRPLLNFGVNPVGEAISLTQFKVQAQRSGQTVLNRNIYYLAIGQ